MPLCLPVLCISVVGLTVLWRSTALQKNKKIYVLDNGKSLMLALSQDASINRPSGSKGTRQAFS